MKPKIGEYYYALGTEEFGKVSGFLMTRPKKQLPDKLHDKYEDGKYVVLALAKVVGEEDNTNNFTVLKYSDFDKWIDSKKLRLLNLEAVQRLFPGQKKEPGSKVEDPEASDSEDDKYKEAS